MSYRLQFDGTNDYCSFANGISGNIGTDAYTVEFRAAFTTAPVAERLIIGSQSGTLTNGFGIQGAGRFQAFAGGGTNKIATSVGFIIFDSTVRTYRFEHDAGGAWRAYRDGSLIQSGTYSTSFVFSAPLGLIGRNNPTSTAYISAMLLEHLEITGFTNATRWESSLSGGTGSTLPSVGGANNATLINFPTDDSQWIFYGSGAITADIAVTMPQMAVAVNADSLVPIFSASVAVTMPQMAIDATANAIAPSSGATIAITMPPMSIAALAASSVPVFASSIALNMPQMLVSATANNITSSVAALVSITMPQMSVSGTAQSTVPIISASVTITMPQMIVRVLTGGISYYTTPSAHIEQSAQSTHLEYVAQSTHLEYTNRSTHIEWRA